MQDMAAKARDGAGRSVAMVAERKNLMRECRTRYPIGTLAAYGVSVSIQNPNIAATYYEGLIGGELVGKIGERSLWSRLGNGWKTVGNGLGVFVAVVVVV